VQENRIVKIGIITYWKSSDNYGEQLQNYALQEYLRGLGHEPFLIRYDYDNDTIYGSRPLHIRLLRACNPARLIKHFKVKRYNKKLRMDRTLHPRGFETFREQYLTMSIVYPSINDLRKDPPEADIYVTGSDQVWNTYAGGLTEMRNRLSAFFLDFGNKDVRRVSYAASWGRDMVPEDEQVFIRPLLARFDRISVRESSGIDLCCQMGREDAVPALDPVLLHDAQKYRDLYPGKACAPDKKYLLFYYLNNDGSYNIRVVFDWAASMDLQVVYVTDDWHDDHKRSFPGVTEWVGLVDNAEYVVTNSYHCCLFALIFGKRFGIIRRKGEYQGMNTRMDSLFKTLGITPRYIEGDDLGILERPAEVLDPKKARGMYPPEDIIVPGA